MILHDGLCSLGEALFRDASNGAAVVVVASRNGCRHGWCRGILHAGASKKREDLEQQLVRNHRHCRPLIGKRSNHRHRQRRLPD